MARPGTRGAWFHGLRVMAIDGLVLRRTRHPRQRQGVRPLRQRTAPSPFPQVRLVALGECGTHAVVDAELGGVTTGEQTFAERLIARFAPGMLVLADRNFYSYRAWQQAVATGAALLWRVTCDPDPASAGVAARRLLPISADQPEDPRPAPRGAARRRGRRHRSRPRPRHGHPRRGIHDRRPARQRGTVLPDHLTPRPRVRTRSRTRRDLPANAGKSNFLSTRSKPTKQATTEY